MKRGIVISDLHLLSWRSEGQERFNQLATGLGEVDTLVMNGDIFDFRWAIRPHEETVEEAVRWLQNVVESHPHLTIYFIPGNHDCLPVFTEQVEALPGISFHAHDLTLGKKLFLHGDAATYRMSDRGYSKFRSAWEDDQPRGKVGAWFYDVSDALKLSEMTHHLLFMGGSAVRRLVWHLNETRPGWNESIDDCYFGHTHMPFENVLKGGVRFHNTGSGIRGMEFKPLTFNH